MFQLRDYQADVNNKIDQAYAAGNRVVMPVLPTGSGKTILFTHRIQKFPGTSIAMAHRAELVTQMSLSLARAEIFHRIIGPTILVKRCAKLHMLEMRKHYINSTANVACASIQTLDHKDFDTRYPAFSSMLNNVGQWICDEGHHLLEHNAWGRVVQKMPNAIGLAPTATPERADGKGLGRHSDGLVDCIVEGPTQRYLIDQGYLSDYEIYAPDPSLNLDGVDISSTTGDFNQVQLRAAAHKQKAKLVGDLVSHYFKWAAGKLTICFVTDLQTADSVNRGFLKAGLKAAVISSKTDPILRAQIMAQFSRGEYDIITNVDILGEGVDVPAVECIIMGRPTESFSLFNQQAGRSLRPLEGKGKAIIIDAVGNVKRHARVVEYDDGRVLIDLSRGSWSLDGRKQGRGGGDDQDDIKIMRCAKCTKPYPGSSHICPHCGWNNAPEPNQRRLENVDGDLTLLSPEQLAELQGQKDAHINNYALQASRLVRTNPMAAHGMHNNLVAAKEQQQRLENSIRFFAGYYLAKGKTLAEIYRRFYNRYGVDTIGAQGLPLADSRSLNERICSDLAEGKLK